MKKNVLKMFAKKSVAILGIMSAMLVGLAGCGKEETPQTDMQETPVVEESAEPTEEVKQPEAEAEVEVEPTEEDVAEPTEETTPEEPKVEMVDFETWAMQADDDEVCLVVWNEEFGIQEVVPTFQETEEFYKIQDGDKFAIPYREKIINIKINDETGIFPDTTYLEVSLPKEEVSQVTIIFEKEDGESETINYLFE